MLPTAAVVCLLLAPTGRPHAPPAAQARPAAGPRVYVGTVNRVDGPAGATAKPDLALTTSDGAAYRIAEGGAAKLLTANDAMHGRPLRLTVEAVAGGGVVRVQKVQTIKGGKVFDVDYWCENCQLSYDEPGICRCCMSETVLRERPAATSTAGPSTK